MNRKLVKIVIVLLVCLSLSACMPRAKKPVIYLYPEEEMDISITLDLNGELVCTYPNYEDGWNVTAFPDGSIINKGDNREYSYLFWEGDINYNWSIKEGFVIKGEETVEFLQDKLEYMGLNSKESNDFITYWLPIMQENEYNLIHFAGEEYDSLAELNIIPKPDSILRIFMVYKPLKKPIEVVEQELTPFKRIGFTVVEWGGAELKN